MTGQIGLEFKKIDLHVHTPASSDYRTKDVTAHDLVKAALSRGLSAIAIADHHTGAWVDAVKAEGKKQGLVVFPAVEVNATGGEEGVHVVCIFDVDKDSAWISSFLSRLRVDKTDGTKESATEFNVGQVSDELLDMDPTALVVLAHCQSSKGVLGDMKGTTRSIIFGKFRPNIVGAESTASDFQNEEKKKNHKRVVDLFDGSDRNFGNRVLGVYQASDAHSLDDIGKAFSWFKVDRQLTIEDLRQCLIDRSTRIRQPHELAVGTYPRILSIHVQGGFLGGEVANFNSGLNSILGAKGSGKSLLVEFLRFAMNQPTENSDLLADHYQKVCNCLKQFGSVEVTIADESGRQYKVLREFNPDDGDPIQIYDEKEQSIVDFPIEDSFPVLFLSQNEIIRIAEDSTGALQRQFIDRFFDFRTFRNQLEILNADLKGLDRQFAECFRATFKFKKLELQKRSIVEEMSKVDRQLTNDTFDKFAKGERALRHLVRLQGYLDESSEMLTKCGTRFAEASAPYTSDEIISSLPEIKRAEDIVKRSKQILLDRFAEVRRELQKKQEELQKETSEYKQTFAPIVAEYERLVKATGGTQASLNEHRKKLLSVLNEVDHNLQAQQALTSRLPELSASRKQLMTRIQSVQGEFLQARLDRCEHFEKSSNQALKIEIKQGGDTRAFRDNLLKFKRGSYLRDDEIDSISSQVRPQDLIQAILAFDWRGRKVGKEMVEIREKTSIPTERLEKLFRHLLEEFTYEDILALYYSSTPQDVPVIRYRLGDEFRKLAELSVGQKATALLIMALSDGTIPVVVDQPEDSLDLSSIWHNVCEKVRGSKEVRQFIFTTHNSSVAVASDSDNYTILDSTALKGSVVLSGSMNDPNVRSQVVQYLEGGEKTYIHKRLKYGFR